MFKLLFHSLKVTTLEDFDEQVTIKVFNYMSVQDYYKDSTNKDRISGISTPLIAINAADDPFAPKPCKFPTYLS